MKRTEARAAALLTLSFTAYAFASPYEIESTDIDDGIELRTGAYYHGTGKEHVITPTVELETSVGRDLELEASADYGRTLQESGAPRAGIHRTLEMKWRFLRGDQSAVSLAAIPELTVPVHDSSGQPNQSSMELELPFVVQKRLDEWTLDARIGYGRTLESSGEDFIPTGVLIRYRATRRLEIGAELVGEAPRRHLEDLTLSVNAGFNWIVTEWLEFEGLLGMTIRNQTPEDGRVKMTLAAVIQL